MVRRLLWPVFAAVLALSLPVSADEALSSGLSEPTPACPEGLLCVLVPETQVVDSEGSGGGSEGGGTCAAWAIDGSAPLTEIFVADPDGCIRGVIRRIIGSPSVETRLVRFSSTPAVTFP